MHILHVLDHSLPTQSGYVYRTMGILAAQRALGWETSQLTTPKQLSIGKTEIIDGWEFYRTPPWPKPWCRLPLLQHLAIADATKRRLRELIPALKPDILHAHSPVLNALATISAGRALDVPVVYEVRALWEDAAASHGTANAGGPRYLVTRALETWALRHAQAVVTISDGLREEIISRGLPASKVTVVPNAVDPTTFRPAGAADPLIANRLGTTNRTTIGFAGSFYAYEGLDLLLDVLPTVIAAVPDLLVLLIGGGPCREQLQAKAAKLQLDAHVRFVDWVPQAELPLHYDLMDLLIYPRRSMRLTELVTPLKPLEAMAQQRIVLASDVGGHKELIEDGLTGYLFKADSQESLCHRLVQALRERDKWPRIQQRGCQFIAEQRNWASVVARYEPVYRAVCADLSGCET
jgi:PEP-CTERM/exosortase A-associated glycosyltransferase